MKFVIVYEIKNKFGDTIVQYKYTQRPFITIKSIIPIAEFGVSVFLCGDYIYSRPCLCFTNKWQIKKVNGGWEEIEFQKGIEEMKKAANVGAIQKLK